MFWYWSIFKYQPSIYAIHSAESWRFGSSSKTKEQLQLWKLLLKCAAIGAAGVQPTIFEAGISPLSSARCHKTCWFCQLAPCQDWSDRQLALERTARQLDRLAAHGTLVVALLQAAGVEHTITLTVMAGRRVNII
jgi:hypothetical protein